MHRTAADKTVLGWDELAHLCRRAIARSGGSSELAEVLARATVDAERRGRGSVGAAHLLDCVEALRNGRLNPNPVPRVDARRLAVFEASADDGPSHLAYVHAREGFLAAARSTGIAFLGIRDSHSWGELSYFTGDVAASGLLAMAGTNSPALMSVFGAPMPVTGTNPFSFAIPGATEPRIIDQAMSEAAWVRVRDAARNGEPIPEGWAVDAQGRPTTDAAAALDGAMLPFGGVKGANLAVVIETLAAFAGGRFSLETTQHGSEPTRIGAWLIAIDPEAFGPGFLERLDEHFSRIEPLIGHDFGRRRPPLERARLAPELYRRLADEAGAA